METTICKHCLIEKPTTKFGISKSKKGSKYRRSTCNTCRNRRAFRQLLKQKQSFKERAIALKGGKCLDCDGVFDPDCFDFHHRDPKTKEFNWGRYAKSSWSVVERNINDCDLLCGNCHRIRHWQEKHGDAVTYKQPTINILPAEPTTYRATRYRQCKRCREILPIKRFTSHSTNPRYRRHTCKRCAARLSYLRRRMGRGLLRIRAVAYKGGRCCVCGFDTHQAAFDFHHRDSSTKEFNWPHLSMRDWDVIQFELDKCDMLCCNCHRLEHKARRRRSDKKEGSLNGLKVGN